MASRYRPPTEVHSPKRLWSLIAVLDDNGPNEHALALGRWQNEPVLAIRWNGNNEEEPIGSPQSRGLPTWFILPPGELTEAILGTLPSDKLTLVRNFLPKPKR